MTMNGSSNRIQSEEHQPVGRPFLTESPRIDSRVTRDGTQLLITEIARALVDSPDEVVVEAIEREESTVLRLHVSQTDVGKVIGKQGRTAHSMRTILSAVSMKYHHRYTLDIVERDVDRDTEEKRRVQAHPSKQSDGGAEEHA